MQAVFSKSISFLVSVTTMAGIAFWPLQSRAGADLEKSADVPAFEEIHKIDVHAHIFEEIPALVEMMRRDNVQIINVCNRGRDGHLETMHRIALELFKAHPELFPFASTFDLTHFGQPGYSEQAIAWLDLTFKNGAVMTKIWKEVGLELRRPDGSFVMPDDPAFDPIYAFLAKRGKPLMAHLAEPIDAWLPLNPESVHYGYYSSNPQWHLYGKPEYPSHAALIAARDHILEKHPNLTMIGAHLGSLEHDLDELGKRLDRYPNFNVDCAARTRNLARYSRQKVREFFIKYQDRILYGVDTTWKPFIGNPKSDTQRTGFVRSLEQRYKTDFRYFSGSGSMQYEGRTVECLGLPQSVLKKFYHENAQRLILHSNRTTNVRR